MTIGRKTGGRKKGARNRATEEARVAAEATGIMPLDYMLMVMRDENADVKRRDGMAAAAAPYLHAKLATLEPKPAVDVTVTGEDGKPRTSVNVRFILPARRDDPDGN